MKEIYDRLSHLEEGSQKRFQYFKGINRGNQYFYTLTDEQEHLPAWARLGSAYGFVSGEPLTLTINPTGDEEYEASAYGFSGEIAISMGQFTHQHFEGMGELWLQQMERITLAAKQEQPKTARLQNPTSRLMTEIEGAFPKTTALLDPFVTIVALGTEQRGEGKDSSCSSQPRRHHSKRQTRQT